MTKQELSALYKEVYFRETDRREKINARLNVPLAIIASVIGAISYMFRKPPEQLPDLLMIGFWLALGLSVVTVAIASWFFRRAWFGHTDYLLPTASSIEEYRNELYKFHSSRLNQSELVRKELEEFIFKCFVEGSSINAVNNDRRSYNLYLATCWITAAIFIVFVSYCLYSFNTVLPHAWLSEIRNS